MNPSPLPIRKDLVLIGGGHSHVIVLKRLGMRPLPGVRITLISPDTDTPYSGMLPGFVAGHYRYDEIHIDLRPLCRFANARFYQDQVIGLDLTDRRIICRHRPAVSYDILSLDVGSTPDLSGIRQAAENVISVKPISRFAAHWEALTKRVCASDQPLTIAVVGAGAGGTEMVLAIRHGLRAQLQALGQDHERLSFHLFASGSQCLPMHHSRMRNLFTDLLATRGIQVHTHARIDAIDHGVLITTAGDRHPVDEVLWVSEAAAQPWLRDSGLTVDERGFVTVADTLESVSHRGVFASGDCAGVRDHPREKSGVFAVRQGKPLERNLRRSSGDQSLLAFTPQKHFLSLISTGDRGAVASRGRWSGAPGGWIWKWKNWLDRRFLVQFSSLPTIDQPRLSGITNKLARMDSNAIVKAASMRCGGCGAKVGAGVLRRVLHELSSPPRGDIISGMEEADDAAVIKVPADRMLVQSVDSFRTMVDDPYVFGRIAANHALGDLYAMGATPTTALALATLPYGPESKVEDTLRQLMTGAIEVLREAQTILIGGHTSEGAELSLGFSITGTVTKDALLRKSGMGCGERLLLTKPIGTGTLFAADMRYRAKGRWIALALRSMQQSNRDGAECLRRHGATASTDVTGFGLLGHLVEMVPGSVIGIELNLARIPLLDGALDTLSAGFASTLQPQNLEASRRLRCAASIRVDPRYGLLFDPQTAGGLLASVPEHAAENCIADLQAHGYEYAAIIGQVLPAGTDPERPIRVIR